MQRIPNGDDLALVRSYTLTLTKHVRFTRGLVGSILEPQSLQGTEPR